MNKIFLAKEAFLQIFNKIIWRFSKKDVYLDFASSTPIDFRVLLAMLFSYTYYANPGAIHKKGLLVKNKINESRSKIAKFINSKPQEIIFTSGGTEGNNLAILGSIWHAVYDLGIKKPHVIISEIEHSATRSLVKQLEQDCVIDATYILPDENGLLNPKDIKDAIRQNTCIISIHFVNNETGTIQPIKEISKVIKQYKKNFKDQYLLLHTDCAQATAYLPINVEKLGVDMLSFNGQKIYGPRSAGVLYVKNNAKIRPIFVGGNQEFGLRPGTESLPNCVGLAKACEIAGLQMDKDYFRLKDLRNYFISLLKDLPGVYIYAKDVDVSPHILTVEIENTFSESLLLYLDARNIFVSSKSACRNDDPDESYVLKALKNARIERQADFVDEMGAIRFSMGRKTTKKEIDYVVKNLKQVLEILRKS